MNELCRTPDTFCICTVYVEEKVETRVAGIGELKG